MALKNERETLYKTHIGKKSADRKFEVIGLHDVDLSVLYIFVIQFARICRHAAEHCAVAKSVQCGL